MNSYMQNAFHFFEKRFHADQLAAAGGMNDDVVSGYSYACAEFPRESFADNDSRGQAENFYFDVVYHSSISGEVDTGLHPELVEAMGAIYKCIAAKHGTIVHVTGDTVLAKFEDLDSVLCCAISVRLAVRRYSTCVSSARSLLFHIGVHCSGDLADDRGNHPAAPDRTARLNRPLHYGGICFSKSVRARLANQSSFKYFPLGKRYVKNINVPVEIFWIAFGQDQIIHPVQADTETIPKVFS